MDITVNGDRVETESSELSLVLDKLGYEKKKVVVAVNGTFVSKDKWTDVLLESGDSIDVLGRIEGG